VRATSHARVGGPVSKETGHTHNHTTRTTPHLVHNSTLRRPVKKRNRSHAHTHDSRTNHTYTNTERATAQRRLIVEEEKLEVDA